MIIGRLDIFDDIARPLMNTSGILGIQSLFPCKTDKSAGSDA